MKDALGQEIVVGSVLVYATRSSSTMTMNVAVVKEIVSRDDAWDKNVKHEFLRCRVIADGGSNFKNGKFVYNPTGESHFELYTGRNVSLSGINAVVVGQVMDQDAKSLPQHVYDMSLISCFSPVGVHTDMMRKQQANIEEMNVRSKQRV